ncbi:MAG: hypothetical protein AAGA55_03425 [Planctomycetota bacterium]
MAEEKKAFNEVRALLSKLDRSIDEARTKRVGPKDEPPIASGNSQTTRPDLDRRIGAGRGASGSRPSGSPETTPVPPSPIQAKRSQYGRARPLNRADASGTRPESENQWQAPKNYDDLTIG